MHKLQELANRGEAVICELSSVIAAEQLVSPKSPNKKKINKEGSSIKAVVQATARVKELLLLDPS